MSNDDKMYQGDFKSCREGFLKSLEGYLDKHVVADKETYKLKAEDLFTWTYFKYGEGKKLESCFKVCMPEESKSESPDSLSQRIDEGAFYMDFPKNASLESMINSITIYYWYKDDIHYDMESRVREFKFNDENAALLRELDYENLEAIDQNLIQSWQEFEYRKLQEHPSYSHFFKNPIINENGENLKDLANLNDAIIRQFPRSQTLRDAAKEALEKIQKIGPEHIERSAYLAGQKEFMDTIFDRENGLDSEIKEQILQGKIQGRGEIINAIKQSSLFNGNAEDDSPTNDEDDNGKKLDAIFIRGDLGHLLEYYHQTSENVKSLAISIKVRLKNRADLSDENSLMELYDRYIEYRNVCPSVYLGVLDACFIEAVDKLKKGNESHFENNLSEKIITEIKKDNIFNRLYNYLFGDPSKKVMNKIYNNVDNKEIRQRFYEYTGERYFHDNEDFEALFNKNKLSKADIKGAEDFISRQSEGNRHDLSNRLKEKRDQHSIRLKLYNVFTGKLPKSKGVDHKSTKSPRHDRGQ